MDAKELIPMIEDRVLLGAADGAIRKTILRALSLLASVEGSGEEIVRELRDLYKWCSPQYGDPMKKAAARIVSDAQEKARLRAERDEARELATHRGAIQVRLQDETRTLRAEIASVKADRDGMVHVLRQLATDSNGIEQPYVQTRRGSMLNVGAVLDAYRAARQKDAP